MIELQLFANDVDKVKGTQIIYLYRLLREKSKEENSMEWNCGDSTPGWRRSEGGH